MPSVLRSVLLALGAVSLASAQLHSISILTPGQTKTTSTPVSPTSSPTPSTSSSTVASSKSSSSSVTTTGDPLVLTTIFTQPTDCATGITEIEAWSTELWQNIVNPVPSLTLSSCYPSQFYYSAVATSALPPFKDLVCPLHWESYEVNSTYLICCPSGYGLFAPSYLSTERPGQGAVCTSSIWPSVLMDITTYNATALVTTIATNAGDSGTLVFATAFDGTLASTIVTSTSSSSSVSPTSTPTTTMSTTSATTSSSTKSTTTSSSTKSTTTTSSSTLTAISQLPTCGQTCFSNMLAQYESLGCSTPDPSCLCRNINFYYGIRDCSNGACGNAALASTVLAFESAYCASATATGTTYPVTSTTTSSSSSPTSIGDLPACGQTCFSNMLGMYSSLGCTSPDPSCVCQNINFYYGIRDCSNGACGTAVASTVIAFESRYCSSALATATATAAS